VTRQRRGVHIISSVQQKLSSRETLLHHFPSTLPPRFVVRQERRDSSTVLSSSSVGKRFPSAKRLGWAFLSSVPRRRSYRKYFRVSRTRDIRLISAFSESGLQSTLNGGNTARVPNATRGERGIDECLFRAKLLKRYRFELYVSHLRFDFKEFYLIKLQYSFFHHADATRTVYSVRHFADLCTDSHSIA